MSSSPQVIRRVVEGVPVVVRGGAALCDVAGTDGRAAVMTGRAGRRVVGGAQDVTHRGLFDGSPGETGYGRPVALSGFAVCNIDFYRESLKDLDE